MLRPRRTPHRSPVITCRTPSRPKQEQAGPETQDDDARNGKLHGPEVDEVGLAPQYAPLAEARDAR
eukprot:6552038-Alexandrium_andersonii.AAC.1